MIMDVQGAVKNKANSCQNVDESLAYNKAILDRRIENLRSKSSDTGELKTNSVIVNCIAESALMGLHEVCTKGKYDRYCSL